MRDEGRGMADSALPEMDAEVDVPGRGIPDRIGIPEPPAVISAKYVC